MKKHIGVIVACGWLWMILLVGGTPAPAMDRWAALSMVESGNNDAAVGQAGEVSRYQIKPWLWEKYCPPYLAAARANPHAALRAAQAIMHVRCREFERHFHRPPTDFEYYVLWNAPAQIRKPGRVVSERASRFCNLVGA
jgi:hypothetical protein